jgi:aminopeptidase N
MSTVLTRDEATDRVQLIQHPAYDISLDLSGGAATFGTDTVARFGCSTPGASTFVDFTGAEVSSAVLNGRALPSDAFTGDRLLLTGLLADNTLEVRGRGRYQHTGAGLNRFVDPADDRVYLHTQFEPFDAHQVFVCFDQPDLKADVTLTVLAPADWVMAPSGAASPPAG